jgi:arginine:agmatine antiporter
MSRPASTAKSLGIGACMAVVIGNMVGSGFYLSPTAVAPYGVLAIVMWGVMGAGAICLGLSFARLASIAPATGGPYAYTRMAYGEFAGFLIGWGYWISIWSSLPVIALAFAGAIIDLIPEWRTRWIAVALTLGAMWLVVLVNLRGVKEAGLFASVTTFTKLIPFAAIAIVGLLYVEPANFSGGFNPSGQSLFASAAALAPLTMFAYLGLESATVPAGDVRDPERTIPRATMLGIATAAILYVLGTTVVMGVVPPEQLVNSAAPFTDAARIMWGPIGAGIVTAAIIVSAIGALNGWTLLMGQVPMAAAQDKLFPALFARISTRGVPAVGIITSAAFATVLVLIQASGSPNVRAFYDALVGLATMTAAIPYAFCALAIALIRVNGKGAAGAKPGRLGAIEVIGFIFAMFTLYGCGPEAVLYGVTLLMLGIPIYVWQQRRG